MSSGMPIPSCEFFRSFANAPHSSGRSNRYFTPFPSPNRIEQILSQDSRVGRSPNTLGTENSTISLHPEADEGACETSCGKDGVLSAPGRIQGKGLISFEKLRSSVPFIDAHGCGCSFRRHNQKAANVEMRSVPAIIPAVWPSDRPFDSS